VAADAQKPSLPAIVETLDSLKTSDASNRRELMEALEQWAKVGFPEEAGRLILDHAGYSFPPINQYPETPNDQLLRLLWNGKTTVDGEDVEASFPGFDEACRASAIRLLAELRNRSASESLARILALCAKDELPSVGWPFLLPLERTPRDPDLLIPSMLALLEKTESVSPVHSALLAYANAGMFTAAQSRECAGLIARQTSRAIDDLHRQRTEHGPEVRWQDDYVTVKIDAGVLLDLLGRLQQSSAMPVFEGAVQSSEPWVKLWAASGLTRAGQAVPHEVFRQIAAWPDCRLTLARELEALERPDLFPNDFMNQPSLAEATMVDWLLFPTELGRAPDEIRQLQVMTIDTDDGLADLYVFAFRTHSPHWLSEKDWVVGVAGPFLVNDQPTFESLGGTFSRFESLSEKSVDGHVETLLGTVEGISGSEG
jgi:hypothetical protein